MKYLLIYSFFITSILGFSQSTIVFYNVENLFDTKDDPHTNDKDFLPDSKKQWDKYKMREKSIHLSKAILSACNYESPLLLGLCEVENREVIDFLKRKTPLRKFPLEIIHYDSPDHRGIDVALLYNKDQVEVVNSFPLLVHIENKPHFATRDILITTLVYKKDTFNIAVNHWPSRMGGRESSNHKRVLAANVLKATIDTLNNFPWVIMGDFNDTPKDESILLFNEGFVNLMKDESNYSYYYRGTGFNYDQFIISTSLKERIKGSGVLQKDWLMRKLSNSPTLVPFRSYQGPIYKGGFSDHLPIYLKLK